MESDVAGGVTRQVTSPATTNIYAQRIRDGNPAPALSGNSGRAGLNLLITRLFSGVACPSPLGQHLYRQVLSLPEM